MTANQKQAVFWAALLLVTVGLFWVLRTPSTAGTRPVVPLQARISLLIGVAAGTFVDTFRRSERTGRSALLAGLKAAAIAAAWGFGFLIVNRIAK